jgi:hypothetical protein
VVGEQRAEEAVDQSPVHPQRRILGGGGRVCEGHFQLQCKQRMGRMSTIRMCCSGFGGLAELGVDIRVRLLVFNAQQLQ